MNNKHKINIFRYYVVNNEIICQKLALSLKSNPLK